MSRTKGLQAPSNAKFMKAVKRSNPKFKREVES